MKKTNDKLQFNNGVHNSKLKSLWNSVKYGIVPFAFVIVANLVSWTGNQLFGATHGFQPNLAIDAHIPYVSWFIMFYFICFPVSAFALFYLFAKDRKRGYDLAATVTIALLISGIVYAFWPTEFPLDWKYSWLSENLNFFDKWVVSTWRVGKPTCLLPSQHCIFALGCILSVVDSKNMKWWYRVIMIVFNIMVICGTVFLKQHFILDFVASLAIMTIVYLILRITKFGDKVYDKVVAREQKIKFEK